jgi:tRNA1Val (adenine37-N6)-methyltransferase
MATNPVQTFDKILGGAFTIVQPSAGQRFAVDSILLARFARPRHGARVLELGAGCGVVGVMIAALHRPRQVVAVELQPRLAAMIAENAAINGIAAMTSACADVRQRNIPGVAPAAFDYVVSNPPYRMARSGRESPDAERRIARGGGTTLNDFIVASARYVRYGGRVALVFTAARTAELIATLKEHSLEPKRIRFVHPMADKPAVMLMVEARKGGGIETTIEPPLFLHARPGIYTAEARELLGRGDSQA